MTDKELGRLAEIIDRWVQPVPGVKEVYLIGSRVRGDHRPDSDLDLRIFVEEFEFERDRQTTMWWNEQNETDFAELKSQLLPVRLEIHRDSPEKGDEYIEAVRAGRASPKLKIGKVVCVCTPPKS
jgi:predicted nucleotidyltransferase